MHALRFTACLSRGGTLESLQDDVEAGGDGSVAGSCCVLVAAAGGRVRVAEACHELFLGGAGPCRKRPGGVT